MSPAAASRTTSVVAFGGNALIPPGSTGTAGEQAARAQPMAQAVAQLIALGHRVVLTHGNGPQVGNLALQQEEAAAFVPPQPLFALGAMTAGQLGSLLALLVRQEAAASPVVMVTHVLVQSDDPAFIHPTKPIGPFYGAVDAQERAAQRGWVVGPDSGRGYRRLVPSPVPQHVVEADAIRLLVDAGHVVIALGGGGVPVRQCEDGRLVGVDAVIDKDSCAQLLASSLGAQILVLVTDVDEVAVDFGTAWQRPIRQMTMVEAEEHLDAGQFPAGSMGPKVSAAVRFLRGGGELALITSARHVRAALGGDHGTRIVRTPR